jgi:hypothetical protein
VRDGNRALAHAKHSKYVATARAGLEIWRLVPVVSSLPACHGARERSVGLKELAKI